MLTCQPSLNFSVLTTQVEGIKLVTQRDLLPSNDLVNWSSLERVFDPQAPNFADFLPYSFSTNSSAGLELHVDIDPVANPDITPPFVFQTTSSGIPTNFDIGDYILFTGFVPGQFPALGNSNPITITFDRPVQAAGTQIAVDDLSNFNIILTAFDDDNNPLSVFSVSGTASENTNNSAQFVGIQSDEPNIKKLVYSYSYPLDEGLNLLAPPRAFGINSLSIYDPNLNNTIKDSDDDWEDNCFINKLFSLGSNRDLFDDILKNDFICDRTNIEPIFSCLTGLNSIAISPVDLNYY